MTKNETPNRPANKVLRFARSLLVFVMLYLVLQTVMGRLQAPSLPEFAPPFALQNLDGETVALADLRGQTVVLNFWATWCGPCRVEIPSFSRFADDHPEIQIFGVAVDGEVEALRAAQADLGIRYPVLRADEATLAAYGVRSLPTTVVVREDGRVRSAHVGMLFRPQLWWMTR